MGAKTNIRIEVNTFASTHHCQASLDMDGCCCRLAVLWSVRCALIRIGCGPSTPRASSQLCASFATRSPHIISSAFRQEWDGIRSEPYKTFRFDDAKTVLKLAIWAVGFPAFIFFGSREQQHINDKENQLPKHEYF